MKKAIIILVIALTAASCGGRRGAKGGDGAAETATSGITYPFTIDVSEEYPMEPVSLQEVFGGLEYIALETTPECLIADLPGLQRPVVTDDHIFIVSGHNPIFHFSRDGRFINRIGSQGNGPGEFLRAGPLCVNDNTEEIFLYDIYGHSILVYGYNGRHKRTFSTEDNGLLGQMTVLNDSTLLLSQRPSDSRVQVEPYRLISGRDGKLVTSPRPPYHEPYAYTGMDYDDIIDMWGNESDDGDGYKPGGIVGMAMRPGSNLPPDAPKMSFLQQSGIIGPWGDVMTLSEFTCDTVYSVSALGALRPRWVKLPSAMGTDVSRRRMSGLTLETEDRAFFIASGFGGNAGYKVDKQTGEVTQTYLYDANLDHERTRNNRIIAPPVGTGRFAMPYQPFQLLGWLEEGKLSGPLATLAATLEETDNPVLLISKN